MIESRRTQLEAAGAWAIFPADDVQLWERWTAFRRSVAVPCLEDQIPYEAERKAAARTSLVRMLSLDRSPAALVWPRVNHVSSEYWREDISALAGSSADGLVIPKLESVEQVREVESWLDQCESNLEETSSPLALVLMIESPLGLQHAFDIATTTKRGWALMFGREDYYAGIRGLKSPQALAEGLPEFLTSRSIIANAARAAGLEVIDGSAGAGATDEQMLADARLSARLGYTAKIAASEAEAHAILRGFTPSDDAIAFAREMIEVAAGRSSAAAPEEVTPPVLRQAKLVLQRAGITPDGL